MDMGVAVGADGNASVIPTGEWSGFGGEEGAEPAWMEPWLCDSSNPNVLGGVVPRCETAAWEIFGFLVQEPMLVPCCLMAALIGFHASHMIKARAPRAHGSAVYAKVMFLFGCMMTDAMFVHCFLYNSPNLTLRFVTSVIDVGLTSCIAWTLMVIGFIDVGKLNEHSIATNTLLYGGYVGIFAGYVYGISTNYKHTFLILYLGIVSVCCGLYLLEEAKTIIRRHSAKGLQWLAVCAVAGMVGLGSLFYAAKLCVWFGPAFGADFWWFALSDVAMYGLYRYYMAVYAPTAPPAAPMPVVWAQHRGTYEMVPVHVPVA